ncbi:YggN family protein [Pseudomonadales bacterium]|nr:YggN family protein [Pseudomonadales bacterium]
MKKAILAMLVGYISMIVIVSSAYASEPSLCEWQLDGNITVNPDNLVLTNTAGNRLNMTRDNQVFIDDQPIMVNERQKTLIANYNQHLRTTVPAIVDIALDGIEIGLAAVTEIFSSIAGTPPPASLTAAMATIRADIDTHLSRNQQAVQLNGNTTQMLDSGMDRAIDDLKPRFLASVTGAVLMNLGQSMTSGDGDLEARLDGFSRRMENLSEELETNIRAKTAKLEVQAQALCVQMTALQATEMHLQAAMPALTSFAVVQREPKLDSL